MLKADIDRDLKTAMLSGDKRLVSILRSIKSAILYKEVADGKRDSGLSDDDILIVLKKEKKSRVDALAMYRKAQESERADEESYQIKIIENYLPENISEEEIKTMVVAALKELGVERPEIKDMGNIISTVKAQNSAADGAIISKVIKELMQ